MLKFVDEKSASRRAALGLGVASAAAIGFPASSSASPTALGDKARFDDPIWNRETAARLQADTTGRQVYGRCSGVAMAVRPGEAVRPILGFEVFSTIRVLRQADGNYQRMTKELIFYTDPATGQVLDAWDNPFTGERVRVVDVANDPYNWIIADTIQPPALPGAVGTGQAVKGNKPYLLHWTEFGPDTVVLTEDFHGYYPNLLKPEQWPRESSGPMVQSSELFRYFIDRSKLEDPAFTHLPHNGSWVRVQPWLPWMLMGAQPGHIMYDGIFRPSLTMDYFPAAVLERVHARYPQYLTAPTKWYGPNYSSIEHYAMEQKPAPAKASSAGP
jgi:hypothetical protein